MSPQILGIDLGTTNSVVATLDDLGNIVVTPNALGQEITPSAVYFDGDEAIVGADALAANALDPDNGVVLIKRRMGTEAPVFVAGRTFAPESISALILRQLVAPTSEGSVPRAVITVPAYFGTAEREATLQAGEIAGITVLELLDEPVAALMPQIANGAEGTFVVYDLGGGTFDTSVISSRTGKLMVVATDGHHSLGGADVDARLVDLVLERVHGSIPEDAWEDFVEDRPALGSLRLEVENLKKALSTSTNRTLRVQTNEGAINVTITREDLRLACEDLFNSTMEVLDRVVAAARAKGHSNLAGIVMVGGSSRIPVLSEMIEAKFGIHPRLVEPDLAVAKGAALRAHWLERTPQFELWRDRARSAGQLIAAQAPSMSVTPRAIGVLVRDSFDPKGTREFVDHLISANTSLPTRASKKFATISDGQKVVRIQVYEQAGVTVSDEVGHNRLVIDGELSGLGELPAGSPIEVILDVAADGQLSVNARDEKSGRSLVVQAFVAGVVDSAEKRAIVDQVGLIRVRG